MRLMKSMIAMLLALAAMVVQAGESAEFRLDTMDGPRVARAVETIAYSTAWNNGGTVSVAVDGVAIKEANAPASGDVVWNAAQATPGTHTLTHTCGGETLAAVFEVKTVDPVVVINFKKEDSEWDQSCDKAYWMCLERDGSAIYSGQEESMPVGTYTLVPYSGETEFADPEPMQITIDGTQSRIEREVVIKRKKVWFNCIFFNQSKPDYGMLPDTLGLGSCCKWRLGLNEWRESGQSIEVPTGKYTLELAFDERIRLMVGTETGSMPITLDGTETSRTEYINALGANGAKVEFHFRGMSSEWDNPPEFDESKVSITLRNSRGTMIIPAGEYALPQGTYRASFAYAQEAAWTAPAEMSFSVDGKDRCLTLNFVDANDAASKMVNIWFDANGGTVDTPVLRYASDWRDGHRTQLEYVPTPRREGFEWIGWFMHKSAKSRKLAGFVPSYNDDEWEKTHVFGENESVNGTPAIHVYALWTDMTPTWFEKLTSIFTASGGDIATASVMPAANGCRTVGECYALGIDPEDPNDDFKITDFKMENGKPVITVNHTEDGSGESFLPRMRTLGKAELSDEWQEVPEEGNPAHRFFKVTVDLP